MLTTLRIRNLALVTDLTLELARGFNAITGETGAGKSIILGALNLVLGERADRTLIRAGAESCSVEALFDISKLAPRVAVLLDENGLEPCEEGQLLLRRTFTTGGANRQFINGSPATLSVLASVGEWLVDMHGPHDHQSLLHPARQLAILDAFGKLDSLRARFAETSRRRAAIEADKAALIVDEQTCAQQTDLLRFQVNEIRSAQLQPGEDRQLDEDYQRASNAARLLELAQGARSILGEDEPSLLTLAGQLGRTLHDLERLDPSARNLVSIHDQITSGFRELQDELSHYADRIDLDPSGLQKLEERLNLLQSLKRKYGASAAEILAHADGAARKLQSLEQRDEEVARLNCELEKAGAELDRAGKELSAERRKVAPRLEKAAVRQLADLGFKQSQFGVTLSTAPRTPSESSRSHSGFDAIEFQFAPNPGEAPRPLRAIASSGEMARVMLALKTVLATEDEIPVLVFDEVDANIGGETASAVGDKMRQIARQRQVLCITHLPQVAAAADAHYVVTKRTVEGRTISAIDRLEPKARVTEIARMLGGQSEAARQHAHSLLKTTAPE